MKKLLYAGIILVSVVAIAAVGYRIYLGIRAGDGEITREVQAERSFEMEGRADDEEETDQDTVSDTDETEETT
ncbi:MAG: hypothetical protein ACOC4I_00935, partial [Spirochaetota bacterium]